MTDLEQAREIIRDLLAERGLPQWLADIATEREALVAELRKLTSTYEYGERMCCDDADHARDCAALRLLRALDSDETQRQVDEAHEWAIAANFYGPVTVLPLAPRFTRFVGLGEAVEFMERGTLPVGAAEKSEEFMRARAAFIEASRVTAPKPEDVDLPQD